MRHADALGHAAIRKLAAPNTAGDRASGWIRCAKGAPYFQTESGTTWPPVGHNEAITWPKRLYGRRDPQVVDRHFARLKAHGDWP